ncbi:uncharacterized protein [Misgurnus anguillicaudatus]|uniref:uncharacterized protein n=1 Tax=Misgurnus anguillicaudatus TaxID=75329 RepID=UPI003CCF2690
MRPSPHLLLCLLQSLRSLGLRPSSHLLLCLLQSLRSLRSRPSPHLLLFPEEPRVATSEETSSLKPPSAPPNVPEEPRVATSEETSSLKPPSAPTNAAFPTKNDLWYTVPQLQLGEERDVEVRPKWARLAGCGIPEEPRVATSEETSSLKPPSAPPNAAFPTKNDLWYTVPLCTTDKEDVDSDLYHHKREDIMETETSLSERAETLVFDLVRLSGSGSVSAEFQFKVGLTLVRFAETSRLACRLARETMDRWIFQLQREGRWVPVDPRGSAVLSPAPVSAPVPVEPRVAALPSPAPVSAPVPEEPRVAALPSPAPVSAPVPEEPRVAALPSPAPVSAPVPEEPRVATLPSPAPVCAPVPEEPRVAALPSPAPVSAPVPEEPRVAALPSPAPVSAPVPEEPRVAALPSPAPVSAPVPEEPRFVVLLSPAPVSAPVPEEPRVAALPSPMSAQQNNEDVFVDMEVDYNSIPQFPTVFASPSDLDQEDFPMKDLSLDEENEDHPLPVPVVAPVPEEPRVAALPLPMSAQQNNEDVFVDMEVDYNSIPQFPTVFASPSDLDQEDFPM